MRTLARIFAVMALLGAQHLLAPSVGAQVDPCKPVALPGLCTSPSPSPSPSVPGGGSGGGGGGGGGGGSKSGGGSTGGGQNGGSQKGASDGAKQGAAAGRDYPFAISGPNNTSRLVSLLTPMVREGQSLKRLLLEAVGPFPVAGPAWWINDWHAPRSGGRVHKGLDIFAPTGTPLVAVADGVVTQKGVGALPGLYVEITDANGIEYFYAHLSAWQDGIERGTRVKMGDVLGFVGNTGNAISTPPHVHFEFQPGGIPHPPKPQVDRWLKLAERKVLAMLDDAGIETITPLDEPEFRLTRMFDLAGGGQTSGFGDHLLLLAGIQPAASSLEVARRTLGQMAWEIDWAGRVDDQLGSLVEDYEDYVGREMIGLQPWPFSGHARSPAGGDGHD